MPELDAALAGAPSSHPGYDVTVIDRIGGFDAWLGPIRDNTLVAAGDWFSHILGQGTVDIQVVIAQVPSDTASGGPIEIRYGGQATLGDRTVSVIEPSIPNELATGIDAQPATPEIQVTLDPDRLNSAFGGYWFDTNPYDADHQVPGTLVDGLRIMEHELGHGLGMVGYRSLDTGALGNLASPFDTMIAFLDGQPYFTGAKAEAVYGGPVPLTPHNFYHYGTSYDGGLLSGVLNGAVSPIGTATQLNALDLAIMGDLGYQMSDDGPAISNGAPTVSDTGPAVSADGPTVYGFYDSASDSQFFTADTAVRDGLLAGAPAMHYTGPAFEAASAATGDLQMYSFLNTANGSHFYTANAAERDMIEQSFPSFAFEGVAFQAYSNDGGGAHHPLFRFYRAENDTHFYTTSEVERDNVIAGWPALQYEGVACNVDFL